MVHKEMTSSSLDKLVTVSAMTVPLSEIVMVIVSAALSIAITTTCVSVPVEPSFLGTYEVVVIILLPVLGSNLSTTDDPSDLVKDVTSSPVLGSVVTVKVSANSSKEPVVSTCFSRAARR